MTTAWTTSQLDSFETCPRQFYHTRVVRDIPYVQNDAAKWGDTVHKAFEDRILKNTPLPTGMAQWSGLLERTLSLPGEKYVETKRALDSNFNPVNYYAPEAWTRGKIDLTIVSKYAANMIDWKTGKRKPSDQLRLYAAYEFAHNPDLEIIKTGYVWLQEKKIDKETITRDQIPIIWQGFLPRVNKLKNAYEQGKWPARPSGLCRKYCSVKTCEYCGV